MSKHPSSLNLLCITTAGLNSDIRKRLASSFCSGTERRKRRIQITLDVIIERFQRAYIQNSRGASIQLSCNKLIDRPEECRQRFTTARGGRNEKMFFIRDTRPRLLLNIRRLTVGLAKPVGNLSVEQR